MTKDRWLHIIRRAGLNQTQACLDLGLARSTASRWGAQVPRYAAAYALLMVNLDDASQARARAEMAGDDITWTGMAGGRSYAPGPVGAKQ